MIDPDATYAVTVEPRDLAVTVAPKSLAEIIGAKVGWKSQAPEWKGREPENYCRRCEREHDCCQCDDQGWVLTPKGRLPEAGRPTRPASTQERYPNVLVLCHCRWESRPPFDARRFGFPAMLANVTLDTWPGPPNTREMITARNYALHWPPEMPNLVFLGDTGRGKTGLACAILREVYERHGVGGRIVTEARLLDRLRASFGDDATESTDAIVQEYLRAPLLVVDDVGTSKSTEWVVDRVFAIVGGRLNAGMPTILTANDRTADGSGWQRVDARVKSRAMDRSAGTVLGFEGPDYRSARRAG